MPLSLIVKLLWNAYFFFSSHYEAYIPQIQFIASCLYCTHAAGSFACSLTPCTRQSVTPYIYITIKMCNYTPLWSMDFDLNTHYVRECIPFIIILLSFLNVLGSFSGFDASPKSPRTIITFRSLQWIHHKGREREREREIEKILIRISIEVEHSIVGTKIPIVGGSSEWTNKMKKKKWIEYRTGDKEEAGEKNDFQM